MVTLEDEQQMTLQPIPVRRLVEQVKDAGEDFEFYPTTDEIIRAMVRDVRVKDRPHGSALDIGAGNGKVLLALRDAKLGYRNDEGFKQLYAIEKSRPLLQQMHEDIFVVGTEFDEQSLFSKRVDLLFCNPPYRHFVRWSEKIIREASAGVVYLVVPERWTASLEIADALKHRDAEAVSIGSFDFMDGADRQARAKVNLLRVDLHQDRHYHGENKEPTDAFKRHFRQAFASLFEKFGEGKAADEDADAEEERQKQAYTERRKARMAQLVVGPSYPAALVEIYNAELRHIESNYALVSELDADLLREFDISPSRIMRCLHARLTELQADYWRELFGRLSSITDRLTSKSRKQMLETLNSNVNVDFTLDNIFAVVIWVIKNANKMIESQLVETYETMVEKANVFLYKSNKKTFEDDGWRYAHEIKERQSHYALDYRIVTHRAGGVNAGAYSYDRGLAERGAEFVGDLLTIARNLGFHTTTNDRRLGWDGRKEWQPGATEEFYFANPKAGDHQLIFDVKGFKNGNVHIRFNKRFILALNVEHGRLKGWLRTPREAADELGDPKAAALFQTNKQIMRADVPMLTE